MRKLFALAVLCVPAFAQTDVWKFSRTATLSAASTAITVSLPATGNNQVELLDYTLQCSADCAVSTERNGTAPTATAGTWRAEDIGTAPVTQPTVRVHYDSNSTGGSVGDEAFVFPANALVPWGLGGVILSGAGTTTNWTVRIGPFTGTYRIQIRVRIRRS